MTDCNDRSVERCLDEVRRSLHNNIEASSPFSYGSRASRQKSSAYRAHEKTMNDALRASMLIGHFLAFSGNQYAYFRTYVSNLVGRSVEFNMALSISFESFNREQDSEISSILTSNREHILRQTWSKSIRRVSSHNLPSTITFSSPDAE